MKRNDANTMVTPMAANVLEKRDVFSYACTSPAGDKDNADGYTRSAKGIDLAERRVAQTYES